MSGKRNSQPWSVRDELQPLRLLSLLCLALLPLSLGLFFAALTSASLTFSQGDGVSLYQGCLRRLGYHSICFTATDPSSGYAASSHD